MNSHLLLKPLSSESSVSNSHSFVPTFDTVRTLDCGPPTAQVCFCIQLSPVSLSLLLRQLYSVCLHLGSILSTPFADVN